MSQEEIKSEDKLWYNIIISRGLIESIFFSICIWVLFQEMGMMLFLIMEGAMSVGPGSNIVYAFLENHIRHGAFIFMLFFSAGSLLPLIYFITYKLNHALVWALISGMIVGALIFTWGTMNFPDVTHLNSPIFRMIYGASLGLMASLVGNMFFLNSLYQRGM